MSFDCQLSRILSGLLFINEGILLLVYHRQKNPEVVDFGEYPSGVPIPFQETLP